MASPAGPSPSTPACPVAQGNSSSPLKNRREWNAAPRLYVGGLDPDVTKDDLRRVFAAKFGPVKSVWMSSKPEDAKSNNFAFIQFEEARHAQDAIRALEGGHPSTPTVQMGPGTRFGSAHSSMNTIEMISALKRAHRGAGLAWRSGHFLGGYSGRGHPAEEPDRGGSRGRRPPYVVPSGPFRGHPATMGDR